MCQKVAFGTCLAVYRVQGVPKSKPAYFLQ